MEGAILDFLRGQGYENLPTGAYGIISRCDDWYRARETDAHRRVRVNGDPYVIERMAFGKRGCADDANLCEVVEINAGGGNEAQAKAVIALLQENAFDTLYRRQLELCSAQGTMAAYWRVEGAEVLEASGEKMLQGGRLRLNPVEAGGYIPLTLDGEEVTEAAFAGEEYIRGKRQTTLVICTHNETGRYQYRTVVFDAQNTILSDDSKALGEVRPFAVMRTACVNTLDHMRGFGLPKILDAIPVLAGLDKTFSVLFGDLDTADKLILLNQVICDFAQDENGATRPIPPNEQLKKQFVLYGQDKLPNEKDVFREIVPEIRVESLKPVIELLLSMVSMMFGFGTRKYSFEQGRLETATQYIGERQDAMQELNRQRKEAEQYITGLVRAGLWFLNTFHGTAWNVDTAVAIEFDDSYITDKRAALADMRADVSEGIGGAYVRGLYLKERYNLSDEEAGAWAAAGEEDEELDTGEE